MPRLRESRSERPHREVSSQISSDRISEGDRRRRLAVTIAAAGDRGEGEARTGGVDVPARLRRRVVRIMVRFRRWKERRASVEVAIYVKREGIETARPRGTKTRPTCSTQSWKRKGFFDVAIRYHFPCLKP